MVPVPIRVLPRSSQRRRSWNPPPTLVNAALRLLARALRRRCPGLPPIPKSALPRLLLPALHGNLRPSVAAGQTKNSELVNPEHLGD